MFTSRVAALTTAALLAPITLLTPERHAHAAASCAIYAAVPNRAPGNLPLQNTFYLAANDPYASLYGAVNNAASLALDQGSATPRPGFSAAVKSAVCTSTSASVY